MTRLKYSGKELSEVNMSMGVATPATMPASKNSNMIYLAAAPGVYTNFGGIELSETGLYVLVKTTEGWDYGSINPVITEATAITNNPDEEDITDDAGYLKLRNRANYKIIRSNFDWTADLSSYENAILDIRSNHDLDSGTVTLPAGITLFFNGGKLMNGTVQGNLTTIKGRLATLFENCTITGTWKNSEVFPDWFGAVGDGVTDCAAALQNALDTKANVSILNGTYLYNSTINVAADGQMIAGKGYNSVLKSAAGSVYLVISGKEKVILRDFLLDASLGTNGGIPVQNGSKDITIDHVYFKQGQQRVWLYECENIKVEGCIFEETGYGVIQQVTYASSKVLVHDNFAFNMKNDFVEANCGSARSYGWTVTDNFFDTSYDYPTPKLEQRFVGFTNVDNIIITGNQVYRTTGDAPIHLEATGKDVLIQGNYFQDCVQGGGNSAYIYMLNSDKDCLIDNNTFKVTDETLPFANAYSGSSNSYTNLVNFTNNKIVIDHAGARNLGGFDARANRRNAVIRGNYFVNLAVAIIMNNTQYLTVESNHFIDCTEGIFLNRTASSIAGINIKVITNEFIGTTNFDIYTISNTNGFAPPKYWMVHGNYFSGQVAIRDTTNPGNNVQNSYMFSNIFPTRASDQTLLRASEGCYKFNNIYQDDAVADLETVNRARFLGGVDIVYPTLSEDQTYVGETINATAGEGLSFGDFLYFNWADKQWYKTDADGYTTARCRAIAVETKSTGQTCKLLLRGKVRNDAWNWTDDELWTGTASGTATNTKPASSGDWVQFLGTALSANTILFNPSGHLEVNP